MATIKASWKELVTVTLGGSLVTFGYVGVKVCFYWPVVETMLSTQFTCVG